MALSDLYSNVNLLLRWLHVLAAITWVGHLYFLNFVNVPLQNALDDAAKAAMNSRLMPRALWWFRWGAMITFFSGAALFTINYMYIPGTGFGPSPLFIDAQGITDRAAWILFGMMFAFIMWFNVWFVIWPAQKKILRREASPELLPVLRRRALLASRTNTYLSGPMLFGMLAPAHYSALSFGTWATAVAIGLAVIWAAIKCSFSTGTPELK